MRAARTATASGTGMLARVAGLSYLVTIAAGMFAEVFVRASIRSSDPLVTGDRFRDLEQLYRIGVLGDGLMLMSYLVVTALLYRLLKPIDPAVSFLAALFSLTGIALLAAAMTILLLPIHVDVPLAASHALRLHSAAFNLTGLFFGPYCALIGWLLRRSGWLPGWIAVLMMLAGAVFVFDASAELVAPGLARRTPEAVLMVSLVAEGSLAIWLAVFGFGPPPSAAGAARENRHAR